MRVVWTEPALAQLESIFDFISQTSVDYAHSVITGILDRADQIAKFPRSGRIVPKYDLDDVREIIEGRYRVIYLVKESTIDVLAVVHTSQKSWPKVD